MQLQAGTAAVDANSLQYALHKKLGDTIEVGGAKFTIAQALSDSVFQSEILVSDVDFQRAFPEEGGYRVFLIDAPEGADAALEGALADYGFDVTSTAARRAAFHRVENTYLSTFQALGGLGLILGTVGLAAVLLRNVLERRRELALLRAVGFSPAHLAKMTIAENLFLLIAGLTIGTACALVAVLPTVLGRGGSVPILSVLALLATVLVVGLIASFAAVRAMNRSPLLDALRSE
jgi:ABC-type antimicrobial peptide transport system permease subunit